MLNNDIHKIYEDALVKTDTDFENLSDKMVAIHTLYIDYRSDSCDASKGEFKGVLNPTSIKTQELNTAVTTTEKKK